MPTVAADLQARALSAHTDIALTGALAPDRASAAGNQTPPTGFVYYAVLALTVDSEFGASTKHGSTAGDGPADGDAILAGVIIPIGAHSMVDLDTVGDVVYLYMMPTP